MAGDTLVRAWEGRGPLAVLLLPVSLLFRLLVALRRWAYQLGIYKSQSVDCAVLVVGNVIAGGAGKTPTTIAIVQHLTRRGLSVGVVSRGYGRTVDDVRPVAPQSDPAEVGDEPLLIARATGAPVWVGRDRHSAAKALLAAHPKTQVIVCDDGLQHYGLFRDLEVCVFDDRGVGNGWMLAAGPLREPWPQVPLACAGQQAGRLLVLHTGSKPAFSGWQAPRKLADHAVAVDGSKFALKDLQSPLLALAGIARPDAFFSALRSQGVPLDKTLALPDHTAFQGFDFAPLQGYQVLCTEKDAVKLWKHWPQALAVPLIQTPEPSFFAALDTHLDSTLKSKLSSRHGHQTA